MRIIPTGDNVLIQLDKINESKEQVLKSGVIIPSKAVSDQEARQDTATVLAVGKGRRLFSGELEPLEVKPGDRIIFNKYAGKQIKIPGNDDTFLLLKECDILAILKK